MEGVERTDLKMWTLCLFVSVNPYRCLPSLLLKAVDGDDSSVCAGSVFQRLTIFFGVDSISLCFIWVFKEVKAWYLIALFAEEKQDS